MQTKVVVISEDNIESDLIQEAGRIIQEGGLVAFPTETVYGLGGDALNPEAASRIYAAKGRPSDNPLIVHIAKWDDLAVLVSDVHIKAKQLADAFWPGPLTMILNKSDIVPKETTGGLDTVAVRMPSHFVALAFIKAAGGFVAAPSANLSGKPSPTLAKYVIEDMDGRIDMILDGGSIGIGLESTIIDLTEEIPIILRPGFVTEAMLTQVIGTVKLDKTIFQSIEGTAPKAPGMKYKHYAPKGELAIVKGSQEEVCRKINELAKEAKERGKKVGIIATEESLLFYQAHVIKSVGSGTDEAAIARRLYQILREFDDEQVEIIYSELFSTEGIGQAVMNRLLKAAGHKVIHV